MRISIVLLLVTSLMWPAAARQSTTLAPWLTPGTRVLLHAHNCYPEDGQWSDRLQRALDTGLRPVAIEQDLVWAPDSNGGGRPVVSHGGAVTGLEPALEDHFFHAVAPIVERALAANRPDTWPVIVLHFEFKTNEPEHHRAIWNLLGRYESWLTTAERTANEATVMPLRPGPVLVLTEAGSGQKATFHDAVPVGARLRIFGTVPAGTIPSSDDREARLDRAVQIAPEALIPTSATNYQRWANHSWMVVERGGQAQAGEWTPADAARLAAVVNRAHAAGLWIRFYTLNGHAPTEGRGWTAGYNFGSRDAAEARWRAAINAGVDFVATDQYEDFARVLASPTVSP
jgi:hypothetical protein